MSDSEKLGEALRTEFDIVGDPYQAGLMIINTCAFIRPAVMETIDHVLEAAEIKKKQVPVSFLPVVLLAVTAHRLLISRKLML